ncbi:adenosylcobalamin-dependent ribonucleoside-diphosphate reductase [Hyphomicrobium sp.]|uniref:adenosylcobalamin-dependent ribonucleoside-diphosphate reductase n=1 Tax=Hyphomicrobium sp. TaxID=82 RepID=UPI002C9D8483|nr:adenosylcobalamin-dependent ribonucleoside-diphosphate reductase [Hyphomicrobium sp.]HRN89986.1 adenosylcobalamin-dependent ribonucleoside-diphosphate reductase [Hyphomicrobium sp.]HRQ27282.1 adenosylcobalamin-dependent ribonucleoside-diphosphate reductase [Hyphomicrobium sp.]
MTDAPTFLAPISEEIWRRKYRFDGETRLGSVAGDETLSDTFRRVARAVASVEKGGKRVRARWEQRFYDAMADFGFVPAGRILAGAGAERDVTLFNCFVMGRIDDDLGAIFENVKEAALTMQQGGGIGHDFSTLRPNAALVRSIGADASGPVSFMDVWDAMCRTIMSAGARRGAMMGTLRCDHPDIEAFVDAKGDPAKLRNFNLSVLITDAFVAAVREDAPWDLVFEGRVFRTVRARDLWARIMRAAYDYAEPGVIFIDRVNAMNNLAYCEEIHATNPCGEQPLPPYGACLLGSVNLAQLVLAPFSDAAKIDAAVLEERVRIAVRFLDNVIDLSGYPLPAQAAEAKAKRRIGLGVTGLADALIAMGVRYGSPEAEALAETWMGAIERAAYLASAELAAEKGAFPLYDADRFLASPNVARLPHDVREAIGRYGIRNGCLTSIAPTGTISLFAGNVSSGVEPVFDFRYTRRVLEKDGSHRHEEVEDLAYARYRKQAGADAPLGAAFVTTSELSPREHLVMQAALQRHVDSSISKTINCPPDISFEDFETIYLDAFDLGLKGCTVYRPNEITGAVLSAAPAASAAEGPVPDKGDERHADVVAVSPPSAFVPERHGDVVYMSRPLDRDPVLAGYTYKIKWPESDHAIYVTINDIEHNGRRRPFEIFINTRNLEHYAWTVALTRMISAVFRRGGDVTFVAEELKAVFDPQGGRWIGGRYVPSLLAAIGDVIEAHMRRIGFLTSRDSEAVLPIAEVSELGTRDDEASWRRGERGLQAGFVGGRSCPKCAAQAYVKEGGCWTCRACGFSRCS